jgi:hypothetical protein
MNLLSQLDSFKNNQKIITYDQSTSDIINAILRQHYKSQKDYDKLYCYFDGGNVYNTAKKIFNYLKSNISYSIEPENLQTVGTPAYILATKKGDCKHYSLMFAGLLDSFRRNTGEKFDLAYRFASYDGSKTPEHVFVVINPGSEEEIWCDAVLDYFNEKKQPNYFKDKKIQNMALMSLSGINERQDAQMNGVLDFLNKSTDKLNKSADSLNKQTTGVVNLLQAGTSAIPVFGQSISSLIGLVSGLFAGHSDSYLIDHAIIDKDWDKAMGILFTWYQNVGFDVTKKPWSKKGTAQGFSKEIPEPYMSLSRFEWMPLIWQQTKNKDLAILINQAIKEGYLDQKYFINSKNEMAAEPTALTTLFGGGSGKTGGVSIPLILGGAALIGFLIFKKKK